MGKQITVGHIIALIIGIMIPLLIWGVNVERTLQKSKDDIKTNINDIQYLKENNEKLTDIIQKNHDETIKAIHSLDLKLKDKANRK